MIALCHKTVSGLSLSGIKCGLILLSLLVYCCVAKWYRYRVRDEVVPVYLMIEERHEREIQQREEYEREIQQREEYEREIQQREEYEREIQQREEYEKQKREERIALLCS